MSDNKKYYYLKLKDNFFDSEEMIILQNMQDGYLYSDILFKMYLRSLKNEGKLMFNEMIPYTPEILAQIVRHNVGVVEKSIRVFHQLGLIEIMDNGAIYMMHIQNFIGHSSSEADRQRAYQAKIKNAGMLPCKKSNRKTTPEIEKEIEKELKKDIDSKKKKPQKQIIPLSLQEVQQYINEKQLTLDAKFFWEYFTASGWVDSQGNKVLNWKQKAITWSKRNADKTAQKKIYKEL